MRTRAEAVLVVTADEMLAERIRWSLEYFGLRTNLATNSVEAARCLTGDGPIGVVVDLRFPEADQVVRRAALCPELHDAPIVALEDHPDDSDSLLGSGCTAVLLRDTAPQAIAEEVTRLIHARTHGTVQ